MLVWSFVFSHFVKSTHISTVILMNTFIKLNIWEQLFSKFVWASHKLHLPLVKVLGIIWMCLHVDVKNNACVSIKNLFPIVQIKINSIYYIMQHVTLACKNINGESKRHKKKTIPFWEHRLLKLFRIFLSHTPCQTVCYFLQYQKTPKAAEKHRQFFQKHLSNLSP